MNGRILVTIVRHLGSGVMCVEFDPLRCVKRKTQVWTTNHRKFDYTPWLHRAFSVPESFYERSSHAQLL